jgi:hypothetical protein
MAKPGRSPWKAAVRDRRYQAIIEAAAAGHPLGTVHALPVAYPDHPTAHAHRQKIFSEARYQGYAVSVEKTEQPDGTWRLTFILYDKQQARDYIAAKAARGEPLSYIPKRRDQAS